MPKPGTQQTWVTHSPHQLHIPSIGGCCPARRSLLISLLKSCSSVAAKVITLNSLQLISFTRISKALEGPISFVSDKEALRSLKP